MGDEEGNGERTLQMNRHTQAWATAHLQSHLPYSTPPALSEPGVWQETRFTSILAHSTTIWHFPWPLVQPSKAQRMDLFSLPFSKDQGGKTLEQEALFP